MIKKLKSSLIKFIQVESSSSIILAVTTILALIIANSIFSSDYTSILNFKFFNLSISHWINDGLMAIFFFLVGLEIKKEIVIGELNTLKKASLPIAAALGGMIVPALIYVAFNPKAPELNGWGIPMATDIAFALGVLSLFGKRIPVALKILLLAVAIVDDLGAIIVIAIFYTSKINLIGLLIASIAIAGVYGLKRFKISNYFMYFPFGIILWFGVLYSGVHATIAGVILGLLTPITFLDSRSLQTEPAEKLIKFLHVPVSFIIMPIFAFANAGVEVNFATFNTAVSSNLFNGIVLGLVLGKPLGILLFSFVSCKLKISRLPNELQWRHIFVLGNIAGIGFTMSLFISKLALSIELEQIAKLAVLMASITAILFGAISTLIFIPKKDKTVI